MALFLLFLMAMVLLLVAVFYLYLFDMVFVGHDFPTTKKGIKKVAEILRTFNRDTSVFYDFGSSRGGMAVGLSRMCPGLRILGIDSSKLRTREAKLWSFLNNSKANFVCQYIKDSDISKVDVVYVYQNQKNTDAVEEKLKSELKTGAMVITNTQSFSHWQPKSVFVTHDKKPAYEKLFVYVK